MASVKPRFTLRQAIYWLLSRLLLFLFLLNAFFYWRQPHMTFYPYADLQTTPAQWGLNHEDVTLTTEDGVRIHGWYLPHPQAQKTLLFFHGNGGNISHRIDSLAIFHRLGLNVLIIDYRGYGQSEGDPSEAGLYLDAMAAWRHLTEKKGVGGEQIIIFGRSLGGSVATQLASQVKPAAVILESTFDSARSMARYIFPLLSEVIWLRYKFDGKSLIGQIDAPIYMAHSQADEIIPYPLGRSLFDAAPEPKQFFEMRGGHNSGFLQSQPEYEQGLRQFIAGL